MTAQADALAVGVGFAFARSALTTLVLIHRWLSARRTVPRSKEAQAVNTRALGLAHRRTAAGTLFSYALSSVVLLLLYQSGAWTFASVGLSRRQALGLTIVVGVFLYYLLAYSYGIGKHFFKQAGAEERAGLRVMVGTLPRTRIERCIVIATLCLLNPIVEELTFRGLLVHQYALLAGNLPRAIVIGAVVNALNHVYQGWRAVPFHLLFYGAALVLLYSPYGLASAIALHCAADVLPFYTLKDRLTAYRKTRRAARRRAQQNE